MLAVLSMLSRGSTDDKLRWLFSLYDVEQDGVVTEPEIVEITDAIFDMLQADMCDGDSSSSEQHARSAYKVRRLQSVRLDLNVFYAGTKYTENDWVWLKV